MMNPSDRLVDLLQSLPSAKTAAERKRSIESIEDLLTKEDVCASLERASSPSNPSWRSVFNAVVQFAVSDLEHISSNFTKSAGAVSGRSAFNGIDRSKEHVSVLKVLLEQMETRNRFRSVVTALGERVLFMIVNQPYNFPPECACSHIRLFERFVLKAGRRLVDLNSVQFHDLIRAAFVNCCHFDAKKSPYVQPAVRVHLAGLAVGLLRFAAEDLFTVRPSVVCSVYNKYFLSINNPTGADFEILQILAGALPDACRALREYPHQLRALIIDIFPKLVNNFITVNCAGPKVGTDPSFIVACNYILSSLSNFIDESISDEIIKKIWDGATKAMEDLISRSRFIQPSVSNRRASVHIVPRANVNQAICDLYIAVAHFKLAKNPGEKTVVMPPSCLKLAESHFWLNIAVKWLHLHPEDIPVQLISDWYNWASTILSKPSKLSIHADVLSLVLEAQKSPNGLSLASPIYSQLWSSVQKAFSQSTAETVFRILYLLVPIVFANRKESEPVLSVPMPQLFSHPSLAIPFLLYYFAFNPPQQTTRAGNVETSCGIASFRADLLAYLDSLGSDLFTINGNNSSSPFDLVSLSQLLLFLLTEEIVVSFVVKKEKENSLQRYISCPHMFFTANDSVYLSTNFFTNDFYDSCDLLSFSNVILPNEVKARWLDNHIGTNDNSPISSWDFNICCPCEIYISYVKIVENLPACLEKRFNTANFEECFVKLSFIAHLALAGPLARLNLLDYGTKLAVDVAMFCTSEQPPLFSNLLHSFLTVAVRAKCPTDQQALLAPFMAPDFIDSIYKGVSDSVRNFAASLSNKSLSLCDVTLIPDELDIDGGERGDNENPTSDLNLSVHSTVKSLNELPVDQVRFLSDLRLLILLFNYQSSDVSKDKITVLLKRIQQFAKPRARNVFFNTIALICNQLDITNSEVYTSVCQTILSSLSEFFRDQHLAALHVSFAREILLRNFNKLGCPFESFRALLIPLITLYSESNENFTTMPKLALLNLLCEFACKADQPDEIFLECQSGDILRLRDILLAFLTDQSMTVRLAATKCLDSIVRASSITAEFFDVFYRTLGLSMHIPDGIRPTEEEINEEFENRHATFLLGLARMASIQTENQDLADCRISSIGAMFQASSNFNPDRVRSALGLASYWSNSAIGPLNWIEPISGAVAYYFVNEIKDEPVTLEQLLNVFDADELVTSGLLEAFLLASLNNDSQSDVIVQCNNLKETPGVAEIVSRVKKINEVLSGRSVTSSSPINAPEAYLDAEAAVQAIVISQRYISDDKVLIRLIELFVGCTAGSASFCQAVTQKRGFLSCFLAAFEKRLLLVHGAQSNFSLDMLRVYARTCRAILSPPFSSSKEADFMLGHVFKTVLSAIVLAFSTCEQPRRGIHTTLSILLDELAIPVIRELAELKARQVYSVINFVAPIFVASINFLSKSVKAKITNVFSQVKMLCIELVKCPATTLLTLPFVDCFATFGVSSNNWLADLANQPVYKSLTPATLCKYTRRCCRSLLRHDIVDFVVPVDQVLNIWSSFADRGCDQKLASLLFHLALRNSDENGTTSHKFRIVTASQFTPVQMSPVHKCCVKGPFEPFVGPREKSEESEELFVQAVIILSHLRHLLLFPAKETITNPNYWPEIVTHAAKLITNIPLNVFNKLPPALAAFFALFQPATSNKAVSRNDSYEGVDIADSEATIWTCPTTHTQQEFEEWLCNLAVFLVRQLPSPLLNNNSSSTTSMLMKSSSFVALLAKHFSLARQILPRILSLLLKHSKTLVNGTLEFLSNGFSSLLCDALSKQNRLVLQLVLDQVFLLRKESVDIIRRQHIPQPAKPGSLGGRFCIEDSNIVATARPFSNALGLDWWRLAQAADICGHSPATTLLYGQLHFETDLTIDNVPSKTNVETVTNVTITSATPTQLANESRKLSVLARNSASLGAEYSGSDVVAGFVAVSDWAERELRFLHYSINGQWSKALGVSDRTQAEKTAEVRFSSGDIIEDASSFDGDRYHLMWKLADWSRLPKCLSSQDLADPIPDAAIYTSLSALNDSVVASCRTSGADCLSKLVIDASVKKIMQSLGNVDQASRLQISTSSNQFLMAKLAILSHLGSLVESWPEFDCFSTSLQPVNTQHSEDVDFLKAAVHVLRTKVNAPPQIVVTEATQAVADLCSHLVSDGKPMLAAKILRRHRPHSSSGCVIEYERLVRLIDAQAAWAVGETRQAVQILGGLLMDMRKAPQQQNVPNLQSSASKLFAKWNMDVNLVSDNVDTIETLRSLLTGALPRADIVEMHMALGSYCEHRYRQLDAYIKSPSFAAKSALVFQCAEELGELKENTKSRTNAEIPGRSRYLQNLEGFQRISKSEIDFAYSQRDGFLSDALSSFLHVMRHSPVLEDIVAYRVVGLWLSNDEKDEVIQMISAWMAKISSAKFVPLFYQLAARYCAMDASLVKSKECLRNLLMRITIEHPYHTLPILHQLTSSTSSNSVDLPSPTTKSSRNAAKRPRLEQSSNNNNNNLACQLLAALKTTSQTMETLIDAYSRLVEAYIDFSKFDLTHVRNQRADIPMPERYFKKAHLQPRLPLLTRTPALQFATGSEAYEKHPSFVVLEAIENKIRLLGGINMPKLIRCKASNGAVYQQLVKGANDDLRQDAVMQQVFKAVNALFSSSSSQPFVMRTYPIIPLAPDAGVIGFCDSTISLGSYLVGRENVEKANTAHSYYRPNDWPAHECRKLVLEHGAVKNCSTEKRIAIFRQIYANFKPVFRFYFIDNFPDPVEFCRHRRNYAVSLAVGSMIGYIVGLGDRHLYNILLDLNTSEVIHIDLGIAFEQGRTLTIPETVPFRLTRDLIDGCGPTGVEGSFRKSAEAVLAILQKNRASIMTVLEVFSYDPLYMWTLNPVKASRLQQNQLGNAFFGGASAMNRGVSAPSPVPSNTRAPSVIYGLLEAPTMMAPCRFGDNQMANRVLLQVDQKLAGEVADRGIKLSVPEQVEWLIQQATNINNLAVIFGGWQAFV